MAGDNLKEINLEAAIEAYLTSDMGGYAKGNPDKFDRKLALDKDTLIEFVKNTQPKAWERYTQTYPTNPEEVFIDRVHTVIKQAPKGLLQILRTGFKDRGIEFKLCYFKPDNSMNEADVELYNKNILHCTRQLHYSVSNENSIDIVLFLNGIPVVSMELKNQFTGQDTSNAIDQYKFDRNSKDTIFEFKNRVFVHFAVDLYEAYMTTKLDGVKTFFLPFNQGSNGAGNIGGKGNPANPDGFTTSYLWEKVLCKDMLMEIIQKYLHIQITRNKKTKAIEKETMIFPRYHQLDVVTKLVEDVKQNGAGKSYLIQHSAGSGKSNSIAWLAYHLASLHNDQNEKIFNSVIVLTDRRVLDSQLQDTITQFDHTTGLVEPIKEGSKQLKNAINEKKAIIISTIQKFPIVYKELVSENRSFAIIADEGHSSQSGKAAASVIQGLGDTEEETLNKFAEQEAQTEEKQDEEMDTLENTLKSHGQHDNLSFFAFTATPKAKTLNRFGTRQPDGSYKAFHVYSMQQAIEEGFILDVLQNYTTYKTYYKLIKKTVDDPQLESAKGAKEITKFQTLHPTNISQKTTIMLNHFVNVTAAKINGRAKAMVVTPSRLHAVRYLKEFKKQIEKNQIKGVDVLVAFSGELKDAHETYTETMLNVDKTGAHIKETQLPEYFKNDFNILIVADKYQTGFDEPLLHTMFVDKKLNDVKAVQTLSRLNRTTKGKTDTFVLDFVNEREDIKNSFQKYFQQTILEKEIDPNELYKLQSVLMDAQICYPNEIEQFADIYYSGKETEKDLGKLSSILKPALDRYNVKTPEDQDKFRKALGNFIKMYDFIIQIVRLMDKDLQKFFVYGKFLHKCLRKGKSERVDLSNKLVLEYIKQTKQEEGSIVLEDKVGKAKPVVGGTGSSTKKTEPLSAIIEKFNERFGTSFSGEDKVLEQVIDDMRKDPYLVISAQNKDKTAFNTQFDTKFTDVMMDRHAKNDEFFKELLSDKDKLDFLKDMLVQVAFSNLGKK